MRDDPLAWKLQMVAKRSVREWCSSRQLTELWKTSPRAGPPATLLMDTRRSVVKLCSNRPKTSNERAATVRKSGPPAIVVAAVIDIATSPRSRSLPADLRLNSSLELLLLCLAPHHLMSGEEHLR